MENKYRTLKKFCWALGAELAVFVIIVEGIAWGMKPFDGFARFSSEQVVRVLFYGASILQFVVIKWCANLPLSGKEFSSEEEMLGALQLSALITFGLCELVAFLGFVAFLLIGQRVDFYNLLGLSLFYLAVYFPRRREWKAWFEGQKLKLAKL